MIRRDGHSGRYCTAVFVLVLSRSSFAGFDIVSVANNHSLDYGGSGFADTRKALANAGILYSGGGANANSARAPRIIKHKGASVAFLAFSEINPAGFAATKSKSGTAYTQSIAVMTNAVKVAAKSADYVIVSVHWGVETSYDPTVRQKREAHVLAGEVERRQTDYESDTEQIECAGY